MKIKKKKISRERRGEKERGDHGEKNGQGKGGRRDTVLSLARSSLVGVSRAPHTLRTSSRACSCHWGCMASSTVVHVSKLLVVCFPAKNIVLHSSTTSFGVIATAAAPPFPLSLTLALIISSSRSFGHSSDSASASAAALRRRSSISFSSDLRISLSSLQDVRFFFVGRNLK